MTVIERSERRYLAGIAVEDATTGAPVRLPLRVSSPTARFFRSGSGVYVVSHVEGLEAHEEAFEVPPGEPTVGSLSLSVLIEDESRTYFPRLVGLALPRSPDPGAADFVGAPVRVRLYRTPRAVLGANWASIAASLVNAATGEPLQNALVRVMNEDSTLRTVALVAAPSGTDSARSRTTGQLLVPVPGIPVTVWSSSGEGPALVSDVDVTLEIVPIAGTSAVFDPDEHVEAPAATVVDEAGDPLGPLSLASGRRLNAGILQVSVPL